MNRTKTSASVLLCLVVCFDSPVFAGVQGTLQTELPKASTDASSEPLRGSVSETKLESDLEDLGISLAEHRPGALPAVVSKVAVSSPAYYGGVAKSDLVTKVERDKLSTYVTIARNGKLYRAALAIGMPGKLQGKTDDSQVKGNNDVSRLKGNIDASQANGGVGNSQINGEADETRLKGDEQQLHTEDKKERHPLVITISLGGGRLYNCFNGTKIKRQLLMKLADKIAEAANKAGPGCSQIKMEHSPLRPAESQYNGSSSLALVDESTITTVRGGAIDSAESRGDGVTLTPVTLRISIGGSRLADAFNNGMPASVIDYSDVGYTPESAQRIKAGGPLLESPTGRLRPTVMYFSVGGSNALDESPNFDRSGLFPAVSRKAGAPRLSGAIQTVPPSPVKGNTRPVYVVLGMGGGRYANSWNKNGSATVLVNEFLDRLTKEIEPDVLESLTNIRWIMDGSYMENSFND